MKRFFIAFCAILFITCSNESEIDSSDLEGVWVTNPGLLETDVEQVTTYDFGTDGSLEILTLYQTIDNELIGYRYRATGTYAVDNNNLLIKRESVFLNDDSQGNFVTSKDELIPTGESSIEVVKVSFQNNGMAMIFDYGPCNDTGNCIGTLNLSKLNH